MKMDKPVEVLLDLTVQDLSMIKLLEPQSEKKGFHQVGPQWYYTDENGNKLLGLQKIEVNSITLIIPGQLAQLLVFSQKMKCLVLSKKNHLDILIHLAVLLST